MSGDSEAMSPLDWLALAFLLSLAVALLVAFFLYLRTAYRKGGWNEVKISFLIASGAIAAWYIVRVAENSHLEMLKEAVNRITR
jgi:RsiW-degrading membrane proteinase PrsW (M82 family)